MIKVPKSREGGGLSQAEIVTIAVFLLGGDQRAVDTEDIAIKSDEIAPGRFSWKKYKNRINLELIRVFLSDAKKKCNNALLSGSGRTGWKLTRNGLSLVNNILKMMSDSDLTLQRSQLKSGSIDEQRWRRERARIISTDAWKHWFAGEKISLKEAQEVFRIDSYATGELRESKLTRVKSLFDEDLELRDFLQEMIDFLEEKME